MTRKLFLTLLAASFGVAAVGNARGGVSQTKYANLRQVAVVTSLGDTLHFVTTGLMVFGNRTFDVAVPEWGMDADVTAHVVDALNLRGRISAASLQLNDADPSAPVAESGNIDFSRGGIARLLAKVKQQGADTLLVVGQGTAQTIAGPRTRYLPGFGLTHTNDIFQCAYVLFTMEICRVDTGARIARRVEEPCFQARKKFAVRASSDQYSAEERAELESALKEEARGRIYLAMDALKLMKDSPP